VSGARAERPGAELPVLEYELFRRLIRDEFGLDYPPHKRDLLRARLDRCLRANGLRRYAEYYRLLSYADRAAEPWRAFAETITNNETYFFREKQHFLECAELLPSLTGRAAAVRALSAGCSSGEEAYGMAMLLAASLGRAARFEVQGVDLSESKLATAREGKYAPRCFHPEEHPPPGIDIDEFMSRDPDGTYIVRPSLRMRVTFARCNLVEADAVTRLGKFDIVFCRNVLIYADEDSIPRFFGSLGALVRPGGYLFLGHSDSILAPKALFRLHRMGKSFAYVRCT
jgi:chemotaxis protein methyltransferase CheR